MIFSQPLSFLINGDEAGATILPTVLKQNGFVGAMLQMGDGLNGLNDSYWQQWKTELHKQGLAFGGWAPLRTNPEQEADFYAARINGWGVDFFVGNAEDEYEFIKSGHVGAARTPKFLNRFRTHQPSIPLALSTFGRMDRQVIEWSTWWDHGAWFLPQAYQNHFDGHTPHECYRASKIAKASPVNLDLSARTAITLGNYPVANRPVPSPQNYRDSIATACQEGMRGFSVYSAGYYSPSPSAWSVYGMAIAIGLIKVGPTVPVDSLPLHVISETGSAYTLGWTPVPGAIGYRFSTANSTKFSHTWDSNRSTVVFGKGKAWYKVEAMMPGPHGTFTP